MTSNLTAAIVAVAGCAAAAAIGVAAALRPSMEASLSALVVALILGVAGIGAAMKIAENEDPPATPKSDAGIDWRGDK